MSRKLIEMHQEYLITCDNKKCDYRVLNISGNPNEDISSYLNMPCPTCGQNLLTQQDYDRSLRFMKIVNFLNKWFSWTMFFVSKNAKKQKMSVDFYNGVKINNVK